MPVLALPAGAALLFGLLIGSFLNVVAWRLPRRESLVRPRSKCPACGVQLSALDNVPLLSWLVLRGRCRRCGEPISARYPIVEAATGLLYVAVVLAADGPRELLLGLLLVTFLVPIVLIDLDHRRIPNVLTGPAAVAAVAAIALIEPSWLTEALVAGAAAGGFFLLAA